VSETFIDGYSKDVMDMLNRFRKVRFLWLGIEWNSLLNRTE
jgi:hypothetical protein